MGQKDISPDELMKRLSELESKVQAQSDSKRLEDFLANYGSKFGNDADIARSFMADLDSRGVEASNETVEELLQALRAEIAELSQKISAIAPDAGMGGELPPPPDMGAMPPEMMTPPPPPAGTGAPPPPDMMPPPPQATVSDKEMKNINGADDTNTAAVQKLIGKLTDEGKGSLSAKDVGSMLGSAIGGILGPTGSVIGGALGGETGKFLGNTLSDENKKVKVDPNTKRSRYLDALEALGVKQSSDFDTALKMGRELSKIIKEQPQDKWVSLTSKFGIQDEDALKKILNAYTSYGEQDARMRSILSDERIKVKGMNRNLEEEAKLMKLIGVMKNAGFPAANSGSGAYRLARLLPHIDIATAAKDPDYLMDEDEQKVYSNLQNLYNELGGVSLPDDYDYSEFNAELSDERMKNRNTKEEAKLMKLIDVMKDAGFPAAEAGDSAYRLARLLPHIDIESAAKDPDYPFDEDRQKVYTKLKNMYKELGGVSLPDDYDYTGLNAELSDKRMKELAGRVGFDEDMSEEDLLELLQTIDSRGPRNASEKVLLKQWVEAGRPKDNWSHGTKHIDFDDSKLNPDNYSPEDIAAIDQLVSNITSGKSKAFTADQVPWVNAWLDFKKQRSKTINSDKNTSSDKDDVDENEIIAQALARKY